MQASRECLLEPERNPDASYRQSSPNVQGLALEHSFAHCITKSLVFVTMH